MEVKERKSKSGIPILYYDEVEPEYLVFKENIRVLPAPFYYEKGLYFTFKKYYAPGEHRYFPEGGFEITGPNGEYRAYDSDQIIVHPEIFKHAKHIEKTNKKRDKRLKEYEAKALGETTKKRGRKPLTDAEKQQRLEDRIAEPEHNHVKGRKRMEPEERIKKEAAKLAERMTRNMTGKRGRPANPELKVQRESDKQKRKLRSGGKRGRPSSKKK